jgi:hypothetical protein
MEERFVLKFRICNWNLFSLLFFLSPLRDDWRAFSESIQKDRRRLEEENDQLEDSNL